MNTDKMGILFKCGKCGHSVNILKALKSLHESEAKYNQAVKFINNGQMETGLGMLLENLYMLETYLMPPFREFHMCQEHMRRLVNNLKFSIRKMTGIYIAWDEFIWKGVILHLEI